MSKTIDLSSIRYYVKAVLSDGRSVTLETIAENIAWEDNEKELAVRLNLTLRDVPCEGTRLAKLLALCTIIYVYADWGEGKKEIFRGTVWEWQHSRMNDDQIILTCYDLLYYLQKSTDNKYYPKGKGTKYVVVDILKSWNVTVGTYTGPDITHEKLLYKNKSVSSMLTETLKDAEDKGGAKAVIRAEQGVVNILAEGENEDIYTFTADTSMIQVADKFSMTELVTRVVIVGKDDKEGRPKIEATIDGKTEYGILQAIQSIGSGKLADAKTAANKTLKEKGEPKRTVTFQAPDFPPIRKGDRIYAKTDQLQGYFIVKGISHNATSMTMQMEVKPA